MRRSLTLGVALALLTGAGGARAQILGKEAALCAPGARPGAALQVRVVGLKSRAGAVRLELYPPNAQDWLADKNKLLAAGKVFRRVIVPVPATGPLVTCLGVPAPGPWAILVIHDPDAKRGFNAFEDGIGLPRDPRIGLSRPRVEMATIQIGPGVTSTTIRLQYLRGLTVGPVRRPLDEGDAL